MSGREYSDRQELETEIKDSGKKIESLGDEQKDHQEDLESLQEKLQILKRSKGLYTESDSKLVKKIEVAIQTRETSVETCKEKIGEVKNQMESKLENLKQSINKVDTRIAQMENLLGSLNHKNEQVIVNINNEIQQQKDESEDAKEKGDSLKEIVQIAGGLAAGAGVAASGIAQLLMSLQSIGIIR
ncbi:hypothetical protein [Nostoc sp. UHCC 0251]|uniref:hypothetical protein n=1 Tax=Nostoc sp. UHCC 0251 TaxID=3110240 RepID=UPI002B1FC27F|nr:hypothetical protein [Nostoc sp. UHCC 0251]MEA5623341.1 hypothetical protein [Nostoc sp. UHCC 0251]